MRSPNARLLIRLCPLLGPVLLSCLIVPSAQAVPTVATGYAIQEYASGFTLPLGIAVDADGLVWVSDSTAGTISTIVAGVPTIVASGVTCPRSLVFVDSGDWPAGLYTLGAPVDDCPDGTEVLSMIDPGTGAASVLWETPDPGGQHWPFDLAWSDDAAYGGYLYLVDSAGPPDAAILLHADYSYSTLTIPENLGSLAFGVGTDWVGSLYVVLGSHGEATDSTLYAMSPTGTFTPITPHGSFSAPGQMRFPVGTGGFATGAYVSDSGVVERVDYDGTITEIVSGLTGATLGRGALAFDATGDTLYVAEAGSGIIWAVTACAADSSTDADCDGYATADDCDDTNAAVNPAAAEVCDGIDDDCDGLIDITDPDVTGTSMQYEDADGDGWGNAWTAREACEDHVGWVAVADDCDDTNAAVNPAALEECGNGLDDDCDPATVDECPADTGLQDTGASDSDSRDTSTPDSGPGQDTDAGAVLVATRCGCTSSGGEAWPGALLGLAAMVNRRRARRSPGRRG